MTYRLRHKLALASACCLAASGVAAEPSGWRLPSVGGAATGGLHSTYAERSDAGMADVYGGLSMLSQSDLLGGGNGARRVGYRIGAVFPIIDKFEAGVDIAGASIAGVSGNSDKTSSFGDIRLRAKYYTRINALGLTVMPGYNLLQGVQDLSSVADVASPLLGVGISYFGRECKAPNPLRLHLNATYVYDRTINFLNGSRDPSRFERFAWQMRDYTYLDARLGVEYELAKALPIVEYGLELPANDFADNALIHTISPGIKFNPWDALGVIVSADLGFGGDADKAPAVPLYDIALTFSYRFKGDINKPAAAVNDNVPASAEPVAIPAAEPLPATPSEAATAPVAEPPAAAPANEIAIPPAIPAPVESPPAAEAAPVEPAATTPAPESTTPPEPAPAKPAAPKKPADGPVSLDQFEE